MFPGAKPELHTVLNRKSLICSSIPWNTYFTQRPVWSQVWVQLWAELSPRWWSPPSSWEESGNERQQEQCKGECLEVVTSLGKHKSRRRGWKWEEMGGGHLTVGSVTIEACPCEACGGLEEGPLPCVSPLPCGSALLMASRSAGSLCLFSVFPQTCCGFHEGRQWLFRSPAALLCTLQSEALVNCCLGGLHLWLP